MKTKKKYPVIGVRVTDEESRYLRREAKARGLVLSKYVKAILFAAWPYNGKNNA